MTRTLGQKNLIWTSLIIIHIYVFNALVSDWYSVSADMQDTWICMGIKWDQNISYCVSARCVDMQLIADL